VCLKFTNFIVANGEELNEVTYIVSFSVLETLSFIYDGAD
jgi:hypothetical protein